MLQSSEAAVLAAALVAVLMGGTLNGSTVSPDSSSPLPATNSGSEVTVTPSKPGAVPYYCSAHASSGMMGAIFVE